MTSKKKKKQSRPVREAVFRKFFLPCSRYGNVPVNANTFTDSEWIFAVVSLIAHTAARVPIRLFRGRPDGDHTEVTAHPLLQIMDRPNEYQTWNDLLVYTYMQMDIFGLVYWFKDMGTLTNRTKELIPLRRSEVTIQESGNNIVAAYDVCSPLLVARVDPDMMVPFRSISPRKITDGISPAMAAARSVQIDANSQRYLEAFFENSARPDFILSANGISPEDAERIEKKWNSKHRGSKKASRMSVLDGEIKFEKVTSGLKDLDLTPQSKERRDRILTAFGVPKAVLGIVEDVNRANVAGSKEIFHSFVIDTRVQELVEKMNVYLLRDFPNSENLFFKADDHIPEDIEQKRKNTETGIRSGYLQINEARQRDGLDPVQGGDVFIVPQGMMAVADFRQIAPGAIQPAPAAPKSALKKKSLADDQEEYLRVHSQQEKKFAEMVSGLFDKQRKTVLAQIKKSYKTLTKENELNPMDPVRWLDEFVAVSVPLYTISIEKGGELGAEMVAAATGVAATFDANDPLLLREVSRMATVFARQVNETTAEELRESLIAGVGAGESEPELADRVDAVFRERKNNASTIARTETTKALNSAKEQAFIQNGVKKKQWATVLDERTRPAHKEAHLQIRNVNEPFEVGGELLENPGVGGAGVNPANVINCRCTVSPIPSE